MLKTYNWLKDTGKFPALGKKAVSKQVVKSEFTLQ